MVWVAAARPARARSAAGSCDAVVVERHGAGELVAGLVWSDWGVKFVVAVIVPPDAERTRRSGK